MGRRKSGRNVNGVILLDKPLHMTSNAALQKVRRFFNANKAGHTGALDPLATGLLPLCFGEATKFSHFSLEADKQYRVTAELGVRTTTSDAEGEVVSRQSVNLDEATIREVIAQFVGEQQQSPSMYSALKHEGRPLYYYAREGIEVPRKTRTITIHTIEFIRYDKPFLTLDVRCSKGTYIRTLIDDLGQQLGCGAHVTALDRTWVEGVEGPRWNLEQLAELAPERFGDERDLTLDYSAIEALLLPHDCIATSFPEVEIDLTEARKFSAGNPVVTPVTVSLADGIWYRVRRQADGVLLGMGQTRAGQIWPKRVCNDITVI